MNVLDAALEIAEQIPVSPEYDDEREFAWLSIGVAAVAVGAAGLQRLALDRLGACRAGAELRLRSLDCHNELRSEILLDFFERLERWENLLFRRELSDLALKFGAEYGLAQAVAASSCLKDAFTRTTFLVELASLARDALVKRNVLLQAWTAANEVEGDLDYALKWVAGGLLDAGLIGEASEAIGTMSDPSIRLDYLDALKATLEQMGLADTAVAVLAQRDQIQAENSNTIPQSELLEEALLLISQDIEGNKLPGPGGLDDLRAGGKTTSSEEVAEKIRAEFPTRVCEEAWAIGPTLLEDLLLFQLNAVQSCGRNDLKIEFVTDLAAAFHRHGDAAPSPRVIAKVFARSFLKVEPASAPSINSRDPSTMTLDEFAEFLFSRPVARSDEERRFMRRERGDDPGISNPTGLVRLATELFTRFGELAGAWSGEQVDQAMWALIGYPFFLKELWMNEAVPASSAAECVAASFHVFADYVDVQPAAESASSFYMWWDESWAGSSPELVATILETLERILELASPACRNAALHGLNHLHPHPGASRAVDAFLEARRPQLTDDDVRYAVACRDGKVM